MGRILILAILALFLASCTNKEPIYTSNKTFVDMKSGGVAIINGDDINITCPTPRFTFKILKPIPKRSFPVREDYFKAFEAHQKQLRSRILFYESQILRYRSL